jgi:hypothetical protein
MKKTPLIALILVITAYACEKAVPLPADDDPDALRAMRAHANGQDSTGSKPDTTVGPKSDTSKAKSSDTTTIPTPPFPQQTVTQNNNNGGTPAPTCPLQPLYGDTIVFPQPTSGYDDTIKPLNNPGPGKYFSWPVGMVLNQNTGVIDLNTSQTGLKYVMGFVPAGTTDTCLQTLIIAGASYYDSVYVLANGATTAPPYFNANPYLPSVCSTPNSCTFDVTGSAAAQKVIVSTSTGVIDLQKTLNGTGLLGGAFGLLPVNGQTLTTTIWYKLNDGSNDAMQNISVQIEYYDSESLIQGSLLTGVVNKLDNLLSGNIISTSANPRPPLVIITRRN